jgi:hypothetical protein
MPGTILVYVKEIEKGERSGDGTRYIKAQGGKVSKLSLYTIFCHQCLGEPLEHCKRLENSGESPVMSWILIEYDMSTMEGSRRMNQQM